MIANSQLYYYNRMDEQKRKERYIPYSHSLLVRLSYLKTYVLSQLISHSKSHVLFVTNNKDSSEYLNDYVEAFPYNDYKPRLIKYISTQYEIYQKLKSFLQFDDNASNTKNR